MADQPVMRSLAGYARSTFWTVGIVQILAVAYAAVSFALRHPAPGHAAPTAVRYLVFAVVLGLLMGVGALFCFAAWAWRHQKRFARPLVAVASLLNLVIVPFGTVAGVVGLYWCCSRKMREAEPLPGPYEHQSKPGDGTHPWMQKAMPVVSIVVLLGSLVAANWWGRRHGLPSRAVDGLLVFIVCDLIAVSFHELGHAVAGWVSDMSLASFTVGPFVAQKRAGRWKFQFSPLAFLSAGGSVAAHPLHLRRLRQRMAFEAAGGPVASLITAALAFTVLLAAPGSGWQIWWKVPALIAAISAGGALLNLIPLGFAAGFSDGALLVQLIRGGPFADLREALKMVGATMVTSIRPRDLDARILADGARASEGRPEEGTLQMIQVICAVDRGEFTLAREHLESSLTRMPSPEKAPDAGCAAEIALYIAYLDGNASRAEPWLRGAEKLAAAQKASLTADSDYWRATTAVLVAEGSRDQAEDAYRQALKILAQKPSTGLYRYERELLDQVRTGDWVRRPEAALSEASVRMVEEQPEPVAV